MHVGSEGEAMLDEWVDAKRTRGFVTADQIRSELRAVGIDPERERPKRTKRGGDGGCGAGACHSTNIATAGTVYSGGGGGCVRASAAAISAATCSSSFGASSSSGELEAVIHWLSMSGWMFELPGSIHQ